WLNRHQSNAAIAIVFDKLFDSALVELRRWAMIARESDGQDLAGGVVLQAMSLPIDTRQAKIRSRRADFQRRRAAFIGYRGGNHTRSIRCEQPEEGKSSKYYSHRSNLGQAGPVLGFSYHGMRRCASKHFSHCENCKISFRRLPEVEFWDC